MNITNEITQSDALLGEKGRLMHTGWSRSMLLDYDRSALPPMRRALRLKEWDSYFFGSEDIMVLLTAADLGYTGYISATVVYPAKGTQRTVERFSPLTLGSMDMPRTSSYGDVIYRSRALSLDFCKSPDGRYIRFRASDFDDVRSLYINAVCGSREQCDTLCVSEGFDNHPDYFCYTHLIGCMPVSGSLVYGADTSSFEPEHTTGCLAWGRGLLPAAYSRKWLQAGGINDTGDRIGISLCDGGAVTLINGKGVRYGSVTVRRDEADTKKPWRLHSTDGAVDLEFTPCALFSGAHSLPFLSGARQMHFGFCSGIVKADGKTISAERIPCCASAFTGKDIAY